jgi:hypothetical protein
MFLFFKQKIVLGFLLFAGLFANIHPMENSHKHKVVEQIQEDMSNAVYTIIVNKLKNSNKQDHLNVVEAEKDKLILAPVKSVILESLPFDLTEFVKNQKFLEDFAKSLVNKIVGTLDSAYIYIQQNNGGVNNALVKLSDVVKLDDCNKIDLTFSLMQSIKEALKPSGVFRIDKDKLKAACKQCGNVSCICGVGCCVAITCAGVGYQHPEVCLSCVKSFPKSSACGLFTALTYCFDKCCCKGYLFKECCSAIKKMLCGIKCCGCCNDDDNKDFKV